MLEIEKLHINAYEVSVLFKKDREQNWNQNKIFYRRPFIRLQSMHA